MVASSPHQLRNARIRELRRQGSSVSCLARSFGVTRSRIYGILEATGGDPMRPVAGDLAALSPAELKRLIRDARDELECRRVDVILGLDGDTVTRDRRPSLADVNDHRCAMIGRGSR